MFTATDFLDTVRACIRNRINPSDVIHKPIRDVLYSAVGCFSHFVFQTVDAEDTLYEMCKSLQQLGTDYSPIVDSTLDDGRLVATLGYIDIVHMMHTAASQYPHLFQERVEMIKNRAQLTPGGLNMYANSTPPPTRRKTEVVPLSNVTVPQSTLLGEVLNIMYNHALSGIPVVDDLSRVVGIYHKEDLSFITAAAPEVQEQIIHNSMNMPIGEVVRHQLDEGSSVPHRLCTCTSRDTIKEVLDTMLARRVTRVVCIDDTGRCSSVISIADIVWYYFD